MNKQEFITTLRAKLSGLPPKECEERIAFYSEMIDDRMEEGVSEIDAVEEIGSVDAIAAQIMAEYSAEFPKEIPVEIAARSSFERSAEPPRTQPKRRMRAWEILLLVLGSPIWLSLGVAAFSVILALYAVLWSLIVSLWAVFVSLLACALGGVVASVMVILQGYTLTGIAMIGAGLFCAGLSVFLFFGCRAATKGAAILTAAIVRGIKQFFDKKEVAG